MYPKSIILLVLSLFVTLLSTNSVVCQEDSNECLRMNLFDAYEYIDTVIVNISVFDDDKEYNEFKTSKRLQITMCIDKSLNSDKQGAYNVHIVLNQNVIVNEEFYLSEIFCDDKPIVYLYGSDKSIIVIGKNQAYISNNFDSEVSLNRNGYTISFTNPINLFQ